MQISRLFEIVHLLLERKTVTAAYLAERFEVSTRTVYRDIDALAEAGVPVYTNRGKGGGIHLLDGFVLDKSLLSDDEQNEILAALGTLDATRYPFVSDALRKLGALFRKSATTWIDVDFSDWSFADRETFENLKHAIIDRRIVAFEYFSSYGERTERTVEPLLLWFKHRSWYLKTFDPDKQDARTFKLSRLKRLRVLDETFDPSAHPETPYEPPDKRERPLVHLRLRIDASQLYRVYDDFDERRVEQAPDGSLICEAVYPEDDWVYGSILSYGTYAEVLEPPHIRAIIREKLEKMLEMYPK